MRGRSHVLHCVIKYPFFSVGQYFTLCCYHFTGSSDPASFCMRRQLTSAIHLCRKCTTHACMLLFIHACTSLFTIIFMSLHRPHTERAEEREGYKLMSAMIKRQESSYNTCSCFYGAGVLHFAVRATCCNSFQSPLIQRIGLNHIQTDPLSGNKSVLGEYLGRRCGAFPL